ncbi:MAG: hypothetical protein WD042_04250 [Phycisphaeraceae bacterium]
MFSNSSEVLFRRLTGLITVVTFIALGGVWAASVRADDAADKRAKLTAEATAAYQVMAESYVKNEWADLDNKIKEVSRPPLGAMLDKQQRDNVAYIKKRLAEVRPAWWKNTQSPSNISFSASIWGRNFMANYVPSTELGVQGVRPEGEYVRTRDGYELRITKLNILVSWKPSLVNNPNPAQGKLSEMKDLKLGDLGETIVWHELGHNYITAFLPLPHVIELYSNHEMLFHHLQEFYADMTALAHASPRSQRVQLMIRLDGLDYYNEEEPHTRAGHGIGAMLLATILEKPEAWPSVHFPPKVPKEQVELNTIIYLYEHWDPNWSLAETRALQELVHDFTIKQGAKVLQTKGMIPLPNRLTFSLMAAQDREHQPKRDDWVAKKLQGLIDAGKADKLEGNKKYEPRRRQRPSGNVFIITDKSDEENPRIDIPW